MDLDLATLTLSSALRALAAGEFTPAQLSAACRERIERLNPQLRAFITICPPAEPTGSGPLAGIPIAVKDLFETAGILTTAGSLFFRDYVPPEDAPVVRSLKSAGAEIVGKTNLHEIALGVTNVNPHFGACRNPWDPACVSGGSSGGSAVAVATGMCLGALGTDTGGSIRIPAALCGVVGLKPTTGRVSLRGVIPLSWNLDHAGPLARSVEDAARLYQVIAGYDPSDPASVDASIEDALAHLDDGVTGWRVALAVGEYFEDLDGEVEAVVGQAAQVFTQLGAAVEKVDLSFLRQAALANTQMTQADGAAYHRQRLAESPDGFGEDVRARLEAGRALTSGEYAMARHTQAELRRRMTDFFAGYDVILTPTTPVAAPLIEGNDALVQARRLTRFTAPFNLTGLPALSLPCGQTSAGLPFGLQIAGRPWGEAGVLRAGRAYEKAVAPDGWKFPDI